MVHPLLVVDYRSHTTDPASRVTCRGKSRRSQGNGNCVWVEERKTNGASYFLVYDTKNFSAGALVFDAMGWEMLLRQARKGELDILPGDTYTFPLDLGEMFTLRCTQDPTTYKMFYTWSTDRQRVTLTFDEDEQWAWIGRLGLRRGHPRGVMGRPSRQKRRSRVRRSLRVRRVVAAV